MICPKCGKENKDDAVFCGYCGTAMHNQEEPREEAKTSPESSDVKTFGLESSIPEEQSQGKDDNSVVNTANPSKPNKKPKKKVIIASICAGAVFVLIVAYLITVSGRSIYLTKQQMMNEIQGTYKYTAGEGDYYFNYDRIVIRDDTVSVEHASYYAWSGNDFSYDHDYEIKRYSFLTGRIYYGAKGNDYLTVNKDGNIINSKDKHVYIRE